MGLTNGEKNELATYPLKGVGQTWCVQKRDNWPLSGKLMTWEIFKKAFLHYFFNQDKREAKV